MKSGVLFISPRSEDAALLSRMLGSLSLHLKHVNGLDQARNVIGRDPYQVILTEARLPDGNWVNVLDLAREVTPTSEVIVTDRFADAHFWAEALNLGAYDLIAQPFAACEVQRILSNACSRGAYKIRPSHGLASYNGFSPRKEKPCLPRLMLLSKPIESASSKS